jgi:hypothetical protein
MWEEIMRWLSRRLVLKHGAATVLPVPGLDSAAPIGTLSYSVEEPSILAAPSGVSWATPIYEAVLSPTDAARRAASELETNAGSRLRMPSQFAERRARFLIDVARSYTQLRDDTATLGALLQAEVIAPDELRNHRRTHEVLRDLLSRERRSSGLRALANRCKLLD